MCKSCSVFLNTTLNFCFWLIFSSSLSLEVCEKSNLGCGGWGGVLAPNLIWRLILTRKCLELKEISCGSDLIWCIVGSHFLGIKQWSSVANPSTLYCKLSACLISLYVTCVLGPPAALNVLATARSFSVHKCMRWCLFLLDELSIAIGPLPYMCGPSICSSSSVLPSILVLRSPAIM